MVESLRPHENLARASSVTDARWRPEVCCGCCCRGRICSALVLPGRIGLHTAECAESRRDLGDRLSIAASGAAAPLGRCSSTSCTAGQTESARCLWPGGLPVRFWKVARAWAVYLTLKLFRSVVVSWRISCELGRAAVGLELSESHGLSCSFGAQAP